MTVIKAEYTEMISMGFLLCECTLRCVGPLKLNSSIMTHIALFDWVTHIKKPERSLVSIGLKKPRKRRNDMNSEKERLNSLAGDTEDTG